MSITPFISKKKFGFWTFLLCAGIVFITQFIILQPVIEYRLFDMQDWLYLHIYRSFKFLYPDLISQLINSWINFGLHETPAMYHTGILSKLFGFNYQAYQIANTLFKTVATLSLFPLILIIFKNKWLAFLSTILYGINSATAGPLQVVNTGAEFLALAFFNIFLITYYYTIFKKNNMFYFLSSLFFLLAYLLYPPRMFPQLLLVPIVEIYWLLTSRKLKNLKFSIIRVVIYIVPVILISLPAPVSPGFPHAKQPLILLQEILNGNWHNLLDPFAGIGWALLTNDFWKLFGTLDLDTFRNFGSYLTFLFSGPLLIFGFVTLILSMILSKKPMKFFLLVFGLTLILEILMFFIANDNYRIFESILKTDNLGNFIIIRDPNIAALDDPNHFMFTKYPSILAIYIFVIAFAAFLEWRKNEQSSSSNKENNLLQAVWVGPIFSAVFHFPGWVIQGFLINDYSSIHRYYLVPAMGISLFLAAIITISYKKMERNILSKTFVLILISVIFFTLFKFNQSAIEQEFLGLTPERVKPADQQVLHNRFIDKFGDSLGNGDVLFYFDLSSKNLGKSEGYYKEALVVSDIGHWIKLRRENLMFSCMGAFTDLEALKDSIEIVNGQINFVFPGQCDSQDGDIGIRRDNKSHLYKLENLRAFRIENGDFVDIKEELIKELSP